MKILVYGAGAIGSVFGGFLSRSGHEITLYGRPWHLDRVKRHGLRVEGIWGKHLFRNFRLWTRPSCIKKEGREFDLVLLTVKSFDTEESSRFLKKNLSPNAEIVALQNGLGNIDTLHRYFSPARILAGRIIFGAVITPGNVKVTVNADKVRLGETSERRLSPRVRYLAGLFSEYGIPTAPVPDIRVPIWSKVIYNCALNPLASILGVHYGALLESEWTRRIMSEVVREAYAVAARHGVRLEPKGWKAYEKLLFEKLTPATYDHHPSMLQDLARGRRTEIDALNGAIVRMAEKKKMDAPAHRFLTGLIKTRERFNALGLTAQGVPGKMRRK